MVCRRSDTVTIRAPKGSTVFIGTLAHQLCEEAHSGAMSVAGEVMMRCGAGTREIHS